MNDLRTAAEQALEALEHEAQKGNDDAYRVERDALRAAIEPVQEPVAWRVRRNDGQYELYFVKASAERAAECYIKRPQVEPLYAAPPQRPPLTDEEIESMWEADTTSAEDCQSLYYFKVVARAVERKVRGEKE